jgi:hypothetical protein
MHNIVINTVHVTGTKLLEEIHSNVSLVKSESLDFDRTFKRGLNSQHYRYSAQI